MNSPTGTITFLFTDIEGSTRLWEQHPEAMRDALARHDVLLHQSIAINDGIVFKTMGDAFCAAFDTAPQALTAALTAQQALQSETWPEGVDLRVRMALHTGTADERDGDYFGPPLNRVARLLGTGHGNQTLLSVATFELTRDALPQRCSLEDLGLHSLRDLTRPEQVYQLCHPSLVSEFPALKSLDTLPNNLPQQVTSFVGRETELAQVKDLLGKTKLLTLTGAGGCGKTRLSLQAAADVLDQYPDGVWLVELAPLADPDLVPQAVASVLGIKEQTGKTYTQALTEHLKTKTLLLVLDNCEHVLTDSATLVDALIRSCPQVKVLATSREGLGIAGELTYPVPSLSLPDPKQIATLASISPYEAVQLFIARALFHKPDFLVTNANAPAVASICHRVDGIPLAIELAAARVRSLSAEEINARLDNQFRLLTGGSRTALPRQQTLRALIDWSYDLLTGQEKSLLQRLSVFSGGWTLTAAEAVCTGATIEDWEVLDLLTSLVDKSLVSNEEMDGQTRYRLLETVRQYARDRLAESDEGARIRDRHGAYFLALAEEAESQLRGATLTRWLARLETEHDNFRTALAWFMDMPNEVGALPGLRLTGALHTFWFVRGYFDEGRRHLTETLAASGAQGQTRERARALNGAGILAFLQGEPDQARLLFEESLSVARALGENRVSAQVLNSLGNMAAAQGEYIEASLRYEECLATFRELGDKPGMTLALNNLGSLATHQGNDARARLLFEECLAICRELGNNGMISQVLNNLGSIASGQGDYAQAGLLCEESLVIQRTLGDKRGIASTLYSLGANANNRADFAQSATLYEESLAIFHELGDKGGIAKALLGLGLIALTEGRFAQARLLFGKCLEIRRELGDRQMVAYCLEAMAHLSVSQDQPTRAAHLWAAAEALREEIGAPLPAAEQAFNGKLLTEARAKFGEETFAAAWAEGRTMSMEEAVEYALGE